MVSPTQVAGDGILFVARSARDALCRAHSTLARSMLKTVFQWALTLICRFLPGPGASLQCCEFFCQFRRKRVRDHPTQHFRHAEVNPAAGKQAYWTPHRPIIIPSASPPGLNLLV